MLRRWLCAIGLHRYKPVCGPYEWPFGERILFYRCKCGATHDGYGETYDGYD